MNQYLTQREPIGTPDVHTTFSGDLYLSILNIDPGTNSVGIHAIINPMVGWIWIATGFLALGSVVLLIPTRRRASEQVQDIAAATPISLGPPAGATTGETR